MRVGWRVGHAQGTCGFDDQKEQQLLDMLAYKDVHDRV